MGGPSPTGRRALAGRVRGAPGRLTTPVAGWPWAKPRSYRQRTPRKMVQLALRGALSDRAASGQVAVVESWDWEVPSTKDAVAALSTLGFEGRVLVVLSGDDERAYKSFRNISGVDIVLAPELNAYDVLCSDWLVFTRATLPGNSSWGEAPAVASKPAARPEPETTKPTSEPGPEAEAVSEPTANRGHGRRR